MTDEEFDLLRLHFTRGLGRSGLLRLLDAFESARDALRAGPGAWVARAGVRPAAARALPPADDPALIRARHDLEKAGARILSFLDPDYPAALRSIHDPPALLYLRGELPRGEAFAVVGARRASASGRRLTTGICRELAARGIAVVSGLARGIDTAAHRGALEADGLTIGVLGCGIDRVYPPENARLFQQILERGAILSEYPPGAPPLAGHFPGRNRLISGLSRGVLVVEAAEESGSLITADFALEQGREVFAVPGAVDSPTSSGVNRLLKDGAHLVTEPRDILEILWPRLPSPQLQRKHDNFAETLSGDALKLYLQLGDEPLHVDVLARKSALTPMELSAILLHLELQGGIEQLPGMHYVRRRPS